MALIEGGGELGDEKLILSIDCSIVSCRASKGKNVDGVFIALLCGKDRERKGWWGRGDDRFMLRVERVGEKRSRKKRLWIQETVNLYRT
jgi:hypothetical protein